MRNQCNVYHPLCRNLAVSAAGHYLCVMFFGEDSRQLTLFLCFSCSNKYYHIHASINVCLAEPASCSYRKLAERLETYLCIKIIMRDLPEQLHFVINVRKTDS